MYIIADLKIGDCARLAYGPTPDYNISSINEEKQTATCVWFDRQKRKSVVEELPLNVLKKYTPPEPLTFEDISKALRR